ncbi:MAG: N-formylglutamate amidohydrolase [Verrucomicrobia bacterium]|nr:N-formylglutamate amidohydrolase [Verrucomicrobiota bacterium]
MQLILTCEHFSANIPRRWSQSFALAQEALCSHRGWDIGAPAIYRSLMPLASSAFRGNHSRLLIDLNRSEKHSQCFSEFSRGLPKHERQELIETIHRPFRNQVRDAVSEIIASGDRVLHLSVHTFTPVLHGVTRNADIGLLYDPSRKSEKQFAGLWGAQFPAMGRVRYNYPYKGTSDGHTTALRRIFTQEVYLGIELEVNQAMTKSRGTASAVAEALRAVL